MTPELIGVLSIGAVAIIAALGAMWSVIRELRRDVTSLKERVAVLYEKVDRGRPSSAP